MTTPKTKAITRLDQIPTDLLEELSQIATGQETAIQGGTGWPWISTRGGVLTWRGEEQDSPMSVVILGVAFENSYYAGAFDPNSMTPPDCQAVGEVQSKLAPPETGLPDKQSDACTGCWANAWASSPRKGSRGKACGNRKRLVILPYHKGVKLGEVDGARLRIPPTSVAAFDKYAQTMHAMFAKQKMGVKLPPLPCLVTAIEIRDSKKNQFELGFKPVGQLSPAEIMDVLPRVREAVRGPLLEINFGTVEEGAAKRPAPKKIMARGGKK